MGQPQIIGEDAYSLSVTTPAWRHQQGFGVLKWQWVGATRQITRRVPY
jgi:hypothetical protein